MGYGVIAFSPRFNLLCIDVLSDMREGAHVHPPSGALELARDQAILSSESDAKECRPKLHCKENSYVEPQVAFRCILLTSLCAYRGCCGATLGWTESKRLPAE